MVTTPLMPCSQQQPALSALPALCRWPTMDQFIIHSCRSPGKRLRREQAAQASHKLSAKKQGTHPYRSSLGSSLPTIQMTNLPRYILANNKKVICPCPHTVVPAHAHTLTAIDLLMPRLIFVLSAIFHIRYQACRSSRPNPLFMIGRRNNMQYPPPGPGKPFRQSFVN